MIPEFYNKIKILLVRRRNSLNYIEFIRGKWETNVESVKKKFIHMTKDELYEIKSRPFEELWSDLWKETAKSKIYMKEYNMAKLKFTGLIQNNYYNLLDDMNITQYTEPEWGFPKGRKNNMEGNLNCATREFIEETNIDINNMHILERLNPMEEEFIGTNDKNYRHVYYLANSEEECELSIVSNYQTTEIGGIGWFTIPEALNLMRPYNEKRIQLIHQIYFFIINMIMNIKPNYFNYIEQ
jgi:8-oxo-dGTP pyrophosphatase MutT (NUDIX family)